MIAEMDPSRTSSNKSFKTILAATSPSSSAVKEQSIPVANIPSTAPNPVVVPNNLNPQAELNSLADQFLAEYT